MSADENRLADAAIRLLRKRQLKQEAREAVSELFRESEGGCSIQGTPIPDEGILKDMKEPACYHTDKPMSERCEFCQELQPLRNVWRKRSSQASSALKTVLVIASRIEKKKTEAGA